MKLFRNALIMISMISAASLVFAGGRKDSSSEQKKYLIATDTTFAPFEFEDVYGNFVGIDIDLLHAISEDQGFTYELQVLGFNAAVQSLEAKQSDAVIAGMSITPERELKFDFSDPYFDSGVVMGIADTNNTISSYDDLKGLKVAVKTGTEGASFAESIKDQYGFTLVYFDDSASMYNEVRIGNSAACFEDSYGFAVNKGMNEELLQMFNEGLANIKANGTYQKILDTYIKN